MFLHFVTLWLWPLTFWINIKRVAQTHDVATYKFGDCTVSDVLVLSCGQTDTQTVRQTRLNALLPRLSSAWENIQHIMNTLQDPASKSLHQLPVTECTFPPLLFLHRRPFSCLERWCRGGMVLNRMYRKGESRGKPANPAYPGPPRRMIVKPARVCVYTSYQIFNICSHAFAQCSYSLLCSWLQCLTAITG